MIITVVKCSQSINVTNTIMLAAVSVFTLIKLATGYHTFHATFYEKMGMTGYSVLGIKNGIVESFARYRIM